MANLFELLVLWPLGLVAQLMWALSPSSHDADLATCFGWAIHELALRPPRGHRVCEPWYHAHPRRRLGVCERPGPLLEILLLLPMPLEPLLIGHMLC